MALKIDAKFKGKVAAFKSGMRNKVLVNVQESCQVRLFTSMFSAYISRA